MTAAFLANVLFSFITSLERREFLKQTRRPEESIAFRTPMMQAMPFSPDRGNSCSANVSPFLNDCEHDQAGDIFKWIYGELNSTFQPAPGKFLVFDQTAFSTGIGNGLSREGVVIHTKSLCRERGCRLHIALHGCEQNWDQVGMTFIQGSGIARWESGSQKTAG